VGLPLALAGAALGAGASTASTLSARASADDALYAQAATVARLVDATVDRRGRGTAGRREIRSIAKASGAQVRLASSARMPAPGGHGMRTYGFQLASVPGRAVAVSVSDQPVRDATSRALLWAGLAALAAFALLALLAGRLLRSQVVRPLGAVRERMKHLRDFGAPGGPAVQGASEIVQLAGGIDGVASSIADLANQAATDPLTGAANRRAFDAAMSTELARAKRHDASLALVIFDFDGFKEINDRHGHAVGDDLLREVAHKLQGQLRVSDVLARVGGDEFALILPDMRPERA